MLRWLACQMTRVRERRAEAAKQRPLKHEVAFLRGLAADARRWRRPHIRPSESPRLIIDGEEVGYLEWQGYDMPWDYGRFHPLPAFEKHRGILDRVEALWALTDQADLTDEESEELHRELFDLMEQVDAMVRVGYIGVYANRVRDFKIHGGQFEYKQA